LIDAAFLDREVTGNGLAEKNEILREKAMEALRRSRR
jgi:hypothetical protein